MDHPDIAKVFDAGTTHRAGRTSSWSWSPASRSPIIATEQALTRERLELFVHVCHAIQHAHQKGIIHRDIKPSNMLVTRTTAGRCPRSLTLAWPRRFDQQLTAETIYTRFAQIIGTPLYMSPEQAEMSGLDVDTRSDIYSLGVLLYELLTGTTPLERKQLRRRRTTRFGG